MGIWKPSAFGFHAFQQIYKIMNAPSIAIYGSISRNTADSISDVDILVSSTKPILQQKPGVSYYTYCELEKIAKSGSLFIQHLKNEARIIHDENYKLRTILYNYKPKQNYAGDIDRCVSNILEFSTITNDKASTSWILDARYVLIRNLTFLTLANYGIYEFSFHSALNKLSRIKGISTTKVRALHQLRRAKYIHRHLSCKNIPIPEEAVQESTRSIFTLFGIHSPVYKINNAKFARSAFEKIFSNQHSKYSQLRHLEAIIAQQSPAIAAQIAKRYRDLSLTKSLYYNIAFTLTQTGACHRQLPDRPNEHIAAAPWA